LLDAVAAHHPDQVAGEDADAGGASFGEGALLKVGAAADSAASEAALRDLRRVIWADVARAYLEIRSLRAQQQWLRRQIDLLDDTHTLLQAQAEGGLADASGPERHQAQIEEVHAQLP